MHNRFVPIKDFEDYLINDEGTIWSTKIYRGRHPKFLKPGNANKHGHQQVTLCKNGKVFTKLIHRLVLETFVGPCPDGMECRHLNGNPSDNRLNNLRWGTHKENMLDRNKHQTDNKGERSYLSKLTWEDVRQIRSLHKQGISKQNIAKLYPVKRRKISWIVNNKTWVEEEIKAYLKNERDDYL